MDEETTMRVFKRDALIMRQMQSLMQLNKRSMTQAELIHFMFDFIAENEEDFFHEVSRQKATNDRLMEEWTRIMLRRMREI